MAQGKMKTLYGLYKILGRDHFLSAAKQYSKHVSNTVEATLAEMESRWYDAEHTITEAEKMVADYNNGCLVCEQSGTLDGIAGGQTDATIKM